MIPHHAAGLKSVFSLLFSSALLSQPGCRSTADALSADASAVDLTTTEWVGPDGSGKVSLPVNQILTPVGIQVVLPGSRPQVLALSPDGRILATSGKTHDLILLDPESGKILERAPLPADAAEPAPTPTSPHILEPDTKGQASYTGLIFSADGSRIFLSNVNGNIKVFGVDGERKAHGLFSIPLPLANAEGRKEDIPAGLAISPDGKFLYVALNLSNRLGEVELEASAGKVLRLLDVGVAPYDVVLAGSKAYVSNWGGRRPNPGSVTGPAGKGTQVRVDPIRYIASEGSVSVLDLEWGRTMDEILVGLHSSGMALSRGGKHLLVANAGSDTVSVIDTMTDKIIETISLKWHPGDFFGASPNALTFDAAGKTLFICNGTQNAVAVVSFAPGGSKLAGLIPVGWFPGAIVYDTGRQNLYVANIKGVGSGRRPRRGHKIEYNSHQHVGSLSLLPVPSPKELESQTKAVLENYRRSALEAATLPPRAGRKPCPVPERAGEPSLIKHVVYIIKENRTYDQVLGDMKEGNGDPLLCIFGEEVTPNQHKLAHEFVLLDNAYCSGVLSADGHQWAASAFATDYMEKSFAGFPRSYPDGMEDDDVDALAYSPTGFLWDNAAAHGKTLRDYGEFAISETSWKDASKKDPLKFLDYYRDFLGRTGLINIRSRPAIESLRPYLAATTVGWNLNVPDVFRAAKFLEELKRFEENGRFPDLAILCLPNDHTSGTKAGSPTPAAQVADNDVALGQIVEGVSRSRFWQETCIFVIEDDPQDGWDHVSAYRTIAFLASPYTKRGAVVSTQFNQTGIVRTIELILGLPPMNQFDATATPLFDCFTPTPDFAPFQAVPNKIPLDQMNPEPMAIADPLLREHAVASAALPLDEVDKCPEDLLNRILWHAMKGSQAPYPGSDSKR